jgi:hypothetical protein
MSWKLEDAVSLCRKLSYIAPAYGLCVGLTGPHLSRDGEQDVVNVLLVKTKEAAEADVEGFFSEIGFLLDIVVTNDLGFFKRAKQFGKTVDFQYAESHDFPAQPEKPELPTLPLFS